MMSNDEQTALSSFDESASVPEDACVRYEHCGETVPDRGKMCGSCLDEARARDRAADYDSYRERLAEHDPEFSFTDE